MAGNVKPLGHRAGKYSNTNTTRTDIQNFLESVPHDIETGILRGASPLEDIFYTDILDTQKYPLHLRYRGFENIGVVRFSLYESELLVLFLSDRN